MTPSYVIPPLLSIPLIGLALVRCDDPWKALVLRSSLGGFASLLFATYGAVDVAVTEALVGTLLSTLLYAVAIKSTTTFRLLQHPQASMAPEQEQQLRRLLSMVGLRLELIGIAPSSATGDLHAAFIRNDENQPTVLIRHRSLLAELTARDSHAVREMNLILDPSLGSR
jgi:putative multicomponent Na+:H+ antiporter subunit B